MGAVFGPLGLLFAAPLTVVAYVAVREVYLGRILGTEPIREAGPERENAAK